MLLRAGYLTMKTETNTTTSENTETKPGLFKRIFTKLDDSMKAKAEEASKSSCCSGDDKGKDGKCC